MKISYLSIQGVRNLQNVSLDLHERYNFFVGQNGSGKTSLLEAIYLLGTARSFRTHLYHKVVHYDQESLTVFGNIQDLENQNNSQLGIKKQKDGDTEIKINQLPCRQSAILAQHLPLQLYYPDSFKIIDSAPKIRREIIDWGVFHCNPDYFKIWMQYQRVLKQRNAWLRERHSSYAMSPWDQLLSNYAEPIHQMRQAYFQALLPLFNDVITSFLGASFNINLLKLHYFKGWKEDDVHTPLMAFLEADRERDRKMGYTHHGPHKADLIIQENNRLIKDIYSRGQQKLVIMAIKLAQGLLLSKMANRQCVYLLDDINAEFDAVSLSHVMSYLSQMPGQVFFTGLSEAVFDSLREQGKMFHVKHGVIS